MTVMADGATVPEQARTGPGGAPRERGGGDALPAAQRKISLRVRLKRDKSLLIMVVPTVLVLLVFNYLPMVGTVSAFEYYDPIYGFLHSNFIGLQNFTQL